MKVVVEIGPQGVAEYEAYVEEQLKAHLKEECEFPGVTFHLGYFGPLDEYSLRISAGNGKGIEIEDFVAGIEIGE
mgnify:CR=1 FL=1|jgi:hypothetical protein